MQDEDVFKQELSAFVGGEESKTEAAAALAITRTDLYRYLAGTTEPRASRRARMMEVMRTAQMRQKGVRAAHISSAASEESVTELRNILLHLVTRLDLDLASRAVNERKGG